MHEPYLGSSSVRLIRSSEKARPVAERNSSLPSPPYKVHAAPHSGPSQELSAQGPAARAQCWSPPSPRGLLLRHWAGLVYRMTAGFSVTEQIVHYSRTNTTCRCLALLPRSWLLAGRGEGRVACRGSVASAEPRVVRCVMVSPRKRGSLLLPGATQVYGTETGHVTGMWGAPHLE